MIIMRACARSAVSRARTCIRMTCSRRTARRRQTHAATSGKPSRAQRATVHQHTARHASPSHGSSILEGRMMEQRCCRGLDVCAGLSGETILHLQRPLNGQSKIEDRDISCGSYEHLLFEVHRHTPPPTPVHTSAPAVSRCRISFSTQRCIVTQVLSVAQALSL